MRFGRNGTGSISWALPLSPRIYRPTNHQPSPHGDCRRDVSAAMTLESFGNILSLLCTIVGLLYCVFKYIEVPKRGFRLLIVFFLAKFLSEYYWTIYVLVMHADPDVSGFTAYLGWNISYLCLFLAVLCMRREGARRFFHPVMLAPILTNVPQFFLYNRYGGLLNNLWEVGITTLTMVFCLQTLVFHLKAREGRRRFPLLSLLVLIFLITEYGMWTSSCFEWENDLLNPYFYCSVLGSLICTGFAYGAKKHYEADGPEEAPGGASELRFQVLIQAIISLVIVGICVAGFFAAVWIKDAISRDGGVFQHERQIVICLFILSAVLILLVLVLVYVLTSRYRQVIKVIGRMNAGKRDRLNFVFTIAVTLALMAFTVVYNSVLLYRASVVSVHEDGNEAIKTMAAELENYLTVASTTLRVTADSVDLIKTAGKSTQELEQFIQDQTKRQAEKFDENFTGLYAYIDGEYLDGLGWVPPEDYEPTQREWYRVASDADGEVVIVSPYVDAQTGSVVITIAQSISRSAQAGEAHKNVVALDVIVNHIQEITESVQIAGKGYGMVINTDGFIIAHQDPTLNGKNAAEVYGPALFTDIQGTRGNMIAANINGEACTLFIAPVMAQWNSVIVISDADLLEETHSQLAINIMVSLIIFCLITFFYYIGYKNEQISSKKVEEMNLQVITALATAIDAKDPYTRGHSTRVSQYAVMIAEALGWSRARIENLRYAALLHDIGKIGVPDSILNKPTRLTDVEFGIIKSHTTMGGEILRGRTVIDIAEDVALSHHERYDGRGYPRGLQGSQMTEEARIVGIADAFDAMNSSRVYRRACDHNYILRQLEEGRGKQFDPEYVDVLIKLWNDGRLAESMKSGLESNNVDEVIEATLHRAVQTFILENASPELLAKDIQSAGSYDGALDVEYSQFARLYDYVANLGKRFNHPFKLVLITLEENAGGNALPVNLENAMFFMDRAIRISIRDVDIVTQYNRHQFLVILLGTDRAGVEVAMDRIFKSYFRMNGSNTFSPSYRILEPEDAGG